MAKETWTWVMPCWLGWDMKRTDRLDGHVGLKEMRVLLVF